jgi:hypothetical protein
VPLNYDYLSTFSCSYTPTTEEGLVKMHRKISKIDVSEYSNDEPSDNIDTEQDEDVQYRSGRLERSSGYTTLRLENNTNSDIDDDPSISLSEAFAASGSYQMELRFCRKLSEYQYVVQKRRIMSEMGNNIEEEDLKANIDKSKFLSIVPVNDNDDDVRIHE